MTAKPTLCLYCHRPLAGNRHTDPPHPYVCDLCMECIRTHKPIVPLAVEPSPQPEKRKSSRKRKRTGKVATGIVALVLPLLPLSGCSFQRNASLQCGSLHHESETLVTCDPRLTLAPAPAPQQEP